MRKRNDKSYLIILILLFIIFMCSFLLYKNMTSGGIENNNEIIGTLTFKHKTIERKYESDVIWAKIESGLTIRNKDTIRSGDYSDAVLTLTDNTKININENSMIYLDISGNDINLNFAYGSMSLSKKEDSDSKGITLKIKSGSNTIEVKNSDLVLEKKGKEELSFQVKNGTARFKNGKEEKEVNINESVKLKDSKIEISEMRLILIKPDDESSFSESVNSIPINFQWKAITPSNLKLEIAFDSRFKRIYKSFNVDRDNFTTNLGQGNYYWRISSEIGKNKKKSIREYSSFRKLTVYTTSLPSLLSPQTNQVFSYLNNPPIVPFNWKKLDNTKNYRLEISKNSNFTELVKSENTTQSSIGVDKLESGKYYARLISEPIQKDFKMTISETVSFFTEKKEKLGPPELINPKNDQEINGLVFKKSGFQFQANDTEDIAEYIFQISTSPNFTPIILEKKSNTNQTRLTTNLENGQYYWRVIGLTANGQKTPFSESRKFKILDDLPIQLSIPLNKSVLEFKDEPVLFQWKRISHKANFLIEISEFPDFKEKIYTAKTQKYSNSYSFSKEGNYFWHVLSVEEDNSILAKSSTYSLQIQEKHELIPIYPSKNEKVDMSPLESISFRWKKNPKIDSYYFELFKKQERKKITLARTRTKNSYFTFKDLNKLDEGNFIWTLQENIESNNQKQFGKKITIPFEIYLSTRPGSPEIITPKKMYVE